MNLTPQQEANARKVYDLYWDSYLNDDIDSFASTLDDAFEMIGTSESEVCHGKADGISYFESQLKEFGGKAQMRNRIKEFIQVQDLFLVNELSDIYVLVEAEWVYYSKLRISTWLRNTSTGWKIAQQHGSFPDARVKDGETIALEKISKENLELRDAVKRRTIELENKNRELAIEASLERVRARTMAMQQSAELPEAANLLFQQIQSMGMPAWSAGYCIWDDDKQGVTLWMSSEGVMQPPFHAPLTEDPLFIHMREAYARGETFHVDAMGGDDLKAHYRYMRTLPVVGDILDSIIAEGHPLPSFQIMHCAYFSHGFLLFITYEPVPEAHHIFQRFSDVFQQTYTRFLDLKKAEAQVREAQTEAALERVRSRSMGMHKSEELKEVIKIVDQQLRHLEIKLDHAGFVVDYKPKGDWTFWIADERDIPSKITHPYFESVWANQFDEAKEKGAYLFATHLNFEEKNKFYNALLSYVPGIPEASKEFYLGCPGLAATTVLLENIGLYIENFSGTPYTDEENATLMRFGKVFQQTYTRFLDLQKAEAQTREAMIEAALERTRTQSMIMQHSKELDDALRVFHEQVLLLGIHSAFSFLWLPDEEKDRHIFWAAWGEEQNKSTVYKSKAINYPLDRNEPATAQCLVDWKGNEPIVSYHVPPAGVENYFAAWRELIDGAEQLKPEYFSGGLYYVEAFMKYGCFGVMVVSDLTEDEKKILGRFAIEFERTYTRFLDLQKAEAQTREAQIEVAVERVRAQAMAMHQTNDLDKVNKELLNQLTLLEVTGLTGVSINLIDENDIVKIWDLSSPGNMSNLNSYSIIFDSNKFPTLGELVDVWKSTDQDYFVLDFPKEKLVKAAMEFEDIHPEMAANFKGALASGILQHQWNAFGRISNGLLSIDLMTPPSDDTKTIVSKMAGAFNMAYMRFLDLQKAESQTQKVKVEVALERVRARALAMQEPEELVEVAQVMRHEMGLLGVEELETSSIYIHDEGSDIADCWYAIKDIRVPEKKLVADHITMELHKTWVGREMLEFYNSSQQQTSIVMQGANRIAWIKYCSGISDVLEDFYGEVIPDRTYHLYKFSNGAIGAAAEGDISEESWELLRRATSVFSLAYSRFKDLTQARVDLEKLKTEKQRAEDALTHLKAAQTQLIQSEKMASLGELTAGIAHEIQNPLNFVNNFSDVNTELIDELKQELAAGSLQSAEELADNIKSNEEKINHHGKRADAIVKGMLQHSRNSSGVKESTDINTLCDEYLRLAYHGMRAKDKSFNAEIKTDFDPSIGLINVVPQDIGRVILNLINNAFQAVSAPRLSPPLPPEGGKDYSATVSISTSRKRSPSGDLGVTLSISDNGPGIPDSIKDKIFQPFFTTKSTGQGTGLGLSLSYDIIKAHGGEIKVESKEGEGTTMIIQLPVS